MIWVLMVIAGGSSSQSGIAIDMSQRFALEQACTDMRDQVRRVGSKNLGMYSSQDEGFRNRHLLSAECLSRVAPTSTEK